jgi:hypothetical protein
MGMDWTRGVQRGHFIKENTMMKMMKAILGSAMLLVFSSGCVIEEEGHRRPHHREVAEVEVGHVHGPGCGHVLIGGIWYVDR